MEKSKNNRIKADPSFISATRDRIGELKKMWERFVAMVICLGVVTAQVSRLGRVGILVLLSIALILQSSLHCTLDFKKLKHCLSQCQGAPAIELSQ